ncbi:ribonuclease E inhibitor RraB [Yoonia sp. MH D7]
MTHDFAAQKAETYAVFADIQSQSDLPDFTDVDYMFAAGAAADWDGFEAALDAAGFDTEREDDNGTPYLVAILADQPISALTIWMGEEMATKIAFNHGFTPDGWGLMA